MLASGSHVTWEVALLGATAEMFADELQYPTHWPDQMHVLGQETMWLCTQYVWCQPQLNSASSMQKFSSAKCLKCIFMRVCSAHCSAPLFRKCTWFHGPLIMLYAAGIIQSTKLDIGPFEFDFEYWNLIESLPQRLVGISANCSDDKAGCSCSKVEAMYESMHYCCQLCIYATSYFRRISCSEIMRDYASSCGSKLLFKKAKHKPPQ